MASEKYISNAKHIQKKNRKIFSSESFPSSQTKGKQYSFWDWFRWGSQKISGILHVIWILKKQIQDFLFVCFTPKQKSSTKWKISIKSFDKLLGVCCCHITEEFNLNRFNTMIARLKLCSILSFI